MEMMQLLETLFSALYHKTTQNSDPGIGLLALIFVLAVCLLHGQAPRPIANVAKDPRNPAKQVILAGLWRLCNDFERDAHHVNIALPGYNRTQLW